MRALLCIEPGRLEVVERARPQPGPGEALIRVRRVGVCGTDLHIYEGSHPYLEYPRVIGHELAGEVAETGPGSTLEVGQTVYVIPYLSCGTCVACRRGKTNCCQRIAVLGVHVDGGMAEYLCVPDANLSCRRRHARSGRHGRVPCRSARMRRAARVRGQATVRLWWAQGRSDSAA